MLESRDILKKYGSKPAVDHMTVTLDPGHIYGLLGPNGSGKSTWMKMITGLIVPDRGIILLDGMPVGPETKKHIAYMSTEPFYYSYMKIRDVGRYYQDFFEDFDPARYEELIHRMNLDMNQKVRSLSSGMAAKLKIAATLSRRAQVYLLDEPLNGIDLVARDEIISIILECISDDSILVLSSHLIEELERIVDSVLFMKDGVLIMSGDVEDLRAEHSESLADLYRELYR